MSQDQGRPVDPQQPAAGQNGFDFSTLMSLKALTSKEPSRFRKLVSLFISGMAEGLCSMRKALEESDTSGLRESAHGLKGTSANMGASRLSLLCARFEELCDGSQKDEIAFALKAIETEASRVTAILRGEIAGDDELAEMRRETAQRRA